MQFTSLRLLTILVSIALPVSAARPEPPGVSAAVGLLEQLHSQDTRVEAVGFRLASSNADLCQTPRWDPGFSVHTLEQYGPRYRAAATQAFALRAHVQIMGVAPASPAAASGLMEGDELVALNGQDLPDQPGLRSASDFSRTGRVEQMIQRGLANGAAVLSLVRAGRRLEAPIRAIAACPAIFQVVPDLEMNGRADGQYVQVSSDMVSLAMSDDELAAVLAHELAHNILRHRARLDALHVDRGLLAPFGRNARLIRETESEADRLSVYLMARAAYDPCQAPRYWDRVRRASGAIDGDPTHPGWSERLRSMREACERIETSGLRGRDLPLPADLARQLPRS